MRRAAVAEFAAAGLSVVATLDARLDEDAHAARTVPVGPGEEPDRFAELARDADYTLLIAPETAGLLEARLAVIHAVGGRSLGSSPEAAALCGDKLALGLHFQQTGIPTPPVRTFRCDQRFPTDLDPPLVLKPRDGAGCCETLLIVDPREPIPGPLEGEFLLQPYRPGRSFSASFIVGDDLSLVGTAEQVIAIRDGRFEYRGGRIGPPDEAVGNVARRAIESVPGLRGWVGVDLIRGDDGTIEVLEINPRLTTSFVGFRAIAPAGSLARRMLAAAGGPSLDRSPNTSYDSAEVAFLADGTIRTLAADHA